jgi:3'(2'), 5'-bisphosphate nucleotidase
MDWENVLEVVLGLVGEASEIVRTAYLQNDTRVEYKAPGDPVTDADRAANTLLCDGLAKRFPRAAIVGEESIESARGDRATAELSFFVDPIDGTRDFIDRTGEFAVMVGVVHEGTAVLGVVKEPSTGRCFAAAPRAGAFEIGANGRTSIRVSKRTAPGGASLLVSRTRPSPTLDVLAVGLGFTVRRTGSAGVKGTRVAAGEADAYIHLGTAGYLWDAAAVDAIVHGAGGRMTDEDGKRIDYAQPEYQNTQGLVVTNGRLHEAVLEAIAAAR